MFRVLPRDAFNDANLLKCIGQLTMLIEDKMSCVDGLTFDYDGNAFSIEQDENDGATFVANIHFFLNGKLVKMIRPMNSRDAWPLIMRIDSEAEYYVFDESGKTLPAFEQL